MKCNFKDRKNNIQKYLNGEMTDDEMATFEDHFVVCEDCMEELRDSYQLVEFIKNEGNNLFPEFQSSGKLKARVNSNADINSMLNLIISYKRISFGIITVVILLFVFLYYKSITDVGTNERITSNELDTSKSTNDLEKHIQNKETIIHELQEDLYASNFEISPNLEYLLNQNYRSNYNIEVISPTNESNMIDTIHFEIKYNSNQHLNLRLLDNQANLVLSRRIKKSMFSVDVTENKLSPGLYYWKLENNEEIIFVGKFFIRKVLE